MSNLPIACSLSAADLASVTERYRTAASQYQATARVDNDSAEVSLAGSKAVLHDLLTEMIERESACCAFLAFDIEESSAGYDVRLRVRDAPGLERSILAELVPTLFPTATVTA